MYYRYSPSEQQTVTLSTSSQLFTFQQQKFHLQKYRQNSNANLYSTLHSSNHPTTISCDSTNTISDKNYSMTVEEENEEGLVNNTSRKRKSISESESSSSWENKLPESMSFIHGVDDSEGSTKDDKTDFLKTPERRLKLTLRMKRSPIIDELIESGTNLSDESCSSNYEPEYEVLRVEGVEGSDIDLRHNEKSDSEASSHKRKKRHKSKEHRHRKEKHSQHYLSDNGLNGDSSLIRSPTPNYAAPTQMKRLRLIFGNEQLCRTINIPTTLSNATSETSLAPISPVSEISTMN